MWTTGVQGFDTLPYSDDIAIKELTSRLAVTTFEKHELGCSWGYEWVERWQQDP